MYEGVEKVKKENLIELKPKEGDLLNLISKLLEELVNGSNCVEVKEGSILVYKKGSDLESTPSKDTYSTFFDEDYFIEVYKSKSMYPQSFIGYSYTSELNPSQSCSCKKNNVCDNESCCKKVE